MSDGDFFWPAMNMQLSLTDVCVVRQRLHATEDPFRSPCPLENITIGKLRLYYQLHRQDCETEAATQFAAAKGSLHAVDV